jgi:hypothetical protein
MLYAESEMPFAVELASGVVVALSPVPTGGVAAAEDDALFVLLDLPWLDDDVLAFFDLNMMNRSQSLRRHVPAC